MRFAIQNNRSSCTYTKPFWVVLLNPNGYIIHDSITQSSSSSPSFSRTKTTEGSESTSKSVWYNRRLWQLSSLHQLKKSFLSINLHIKCTDSSFHQSIKWTVQLILKVILHKCFGLFCYIGDVWRPGSHLNTTANWFTMSGLYFGGIEGSVQVKIRAYHSLMGGWVYYSHI